MLYQKLWKSTRLVRSLRPHVLQFTFHWLRQLNFADFLPFHGDNRAGSKLLSKCAICESVNKRIYHYTIIMLVRSLVKPILFTYFHIVCLATLVIISTCIVVFFSFRFSPLLFSFRFICIIYFGRATANRLSLLNCLYLTFVICIYLYCSGFCSADW